MKSTLKSKRSFSQAVIQWYHRHGRKHLPWQQNPGPYQVWVSEIMLQQTQVATVIGYYERFMQRFPTIFDLAQADIDEVLHYWAGLGYYARGRNLHKTARKLTLEFGGVFPDTVEGLMALPGIGRSTAGAILSLGYHQSGVILDGNVKRVLARFSATKSWTGEPKTQQKLWDLATSLTPGSPDDNIQAYNQAMMDLGAMVCTRTKPRCEICPLTQGCQAYAQGLTQLIPAPKPRKTLPEREGAFWVFVRDDGAVLLKRRPSPGIWGGLWCFPEAGTVELEDFSISEVEILKDSFHTFTHFRWHLRLTLMKVDNLDLNRPDCIWYNGRGGPLGLAAVVKKTLSLISASISEHA